MKNPPKLKQKLEVKKYHGIEIKDEYRWIHQKNIWKRKTLIQNLK